MTIKDVAALSGVSPAAVSRYLNGGSLSEEKRQRIQRTIDETGYRPTAAAQMMRVGYQRQIGVLVPKLHSDAVVLVTAGIARRIQEDGFLSVLGVTHANEQKELEYLSIMEANKAAGVIIMGTGVSARRIEAYKSIGIPLVVTGQNIPGLACVYHDDYGAAHELMKRIIEAGRKNIAYIGVTERDPQAGRARHQGARTAYKEADISSGCFLTGIADFTADSGYGVMNELLKQNDDIDGVLCATDTIAVGATRALIEAGKNPGTDVSIAGIGDSWMDEYSKVPLTTARLFFKQCGEDAAGMLISFLRGMEMDEAVPTRQLCLDYEIVDRGSI